MGHPVVHFEVTGKDGAKLASFFSDLFGWQIDTNNPLGYGIIDRDQNVGKDGVGIGGGVGQAQAGSDGLVTFYVGVPDVDATLAKAEQLGGKRLFGPAEVPGEGVGLPEGRAARKRRAILDRAPMRLVVAPIPTVVTVLRDALQGGRRGTPAAWRRASVVRLRHRDATVLAPLADRSVTSCPSLLEPIGTDARSETMEAALDRCTPSST